MKLLCLSLSTNRITRINHEEMIFPKLYICKKKDINKYEFVDIFFELYLITIIVIIWSPLRKIKISINVVIRKPIHIELRINAKILNVVHWHPAMRLLNYRLHILKIEKRNLFHPFLISHIISTYSLINISLIISTYSIINISPIISIYSIINNTNIKLVFIILSYLDIIWYNSMVILFHCKRYTSTEDLSCVLFEKINFLDVLFLSKCVQLC